MKIYKRLLMSIHFRIENILNLLFDRLKKRCMAHDKKDSLAWGRPLFNLPFDISGPSTTNDGGLCIGRHPKNSLTWTWTLWWHGGFNFRFVTQKQMPKYRRK